MKVYFCFLKYNSAMKNEISLLVHFDRVIGFLFHCSFSGFLIYFNLI